MIRFFCPNFWSLKAVLWPLAVKFDVATSPFLKLDKLIGARVDGCLSDMWHGFFLNLRCDMGSPPPPQKEKKGEKKEGGTFHGREYHIEPRG